MDIDSHLFAWQGARMAASVGRKGMGQLIQFEENGTILANKDRLLSPSFKS